MAKAVGAPIASPPPRAPGSFLPPPLGCVKMSELGHPAVGAADRGRPLAAIAPGWLARRLTLACWPERSV